VNPHTLVHVCDECSYGQGGGGTSNGGKCVICDNQGVTDAYYCRECTQLEKDRDGCPKIVNLGEAKKDNFYQEKKVSAASWVKGEGGGMCVCVCVCV
jgi:PHD finger-like domain-containing protein 5A